MSYDPWDPMGESRDREAERREERRRYEGDVYYDVWRSGRNPDRIDYERVSDAYYGGHSADEAAAAEIRQQDAIRQRREAEEVAQQQADYEAYMQEQEAQREQEVEPPPAPEPEPDPTP